MTFNQCNFDSAPDSSRFTRRQAAAIALIMTVVILAAAVEMLMEKGHKWIRTKTKTKQKQNKPQPEAYRTLKRRAVTIGTAAISLATVLTLIL
jgi:hypothetical protein